MAEHVSEESHVAAWVPEGISAEDLHENTAGASSIVEGVTAHDTHEIAANIPLVAENDDFNDNDSAFGSSNAGSSTTSIESSILRYRVENGRTYHSFKEEKNYVLPNDDIENDRLDLQHHLFYLTFGGKLFTCPATRFNRVLDVGTGTGIWAIDFADEHPEANVIGIDLSPIQPAFVPPNASFFIDDLEADWTYSSKFDFIYCRMNTGSIVDWGKFVQQSFGNLEPGGYLEIADIAFPIQADDDSMPPDCPLAKWSDLMFEASKVLQRPLNSGKFCKDLLVASGFTDVVETQYKWPMNRWPKDRKHKELGMWANENVCAGLQGLSLALFTRGLGWSVEELEVLLAAVRKDMKNPRIHSYWPIYVISGQKPPVNQHEIWNAQY